MFRTIRLTILASVLSAAVVPVATATTGIQPTGAGVPPGFAVTPYADIGGSITSLAFGPDTRDPAEARLYVADFANGRVLAIDDTAGVGGEPAVFASGFGSPLGIVVGDDGTVFVSDSEPARDGPFGNRAYGRVWRVRDTNGDGTADEQQVVLKDLPNGRHNTNGLAFGPGGMLFVTNGNATDDGIEGGEPEAFPWSGSVIRIHPSATNVSAASLRPRRHLVATGMRNDYDIAFSPVDPTRLLITMNGVDDARPAEEEEPTNPEDSDDLLLVTDVDDWRAPGGLHMPNGLDGSARRRPVIDHFGFPSCLYSVERQGNLRPYANPHPDVAAAFGPCRPARITRPIASFGLHPSADGLAFQTTDAWGAGFEHDLFVAEFGNFSGDEVVGHVVVRVDLDPSGLVVEGQRDFLSGSLPLDLTFDAAGDMFVGDFGGHIVKVTKLA